MVNFYKKLGNECFDKILEINPSGGMRNFIRMAVEFGYKRGIAVKAEGSYRIQERDMSPDVIEKNVGTEKKPIWKVYIAPLGSRHDNIAHELIKTLNNDKIREDIKA